MIFIAAEAAFVTLDLPLEGRRDGVGMRGPANNASTEAALGGGMARKRPDDLAVEQNRHLMLSRPVIESSERPTAAVGYPGNPGIYPLSR